MYSFLMMSAIATGGDTPSFHWGAGCYGASCSGVVATGCCGGYAAPTGCCGGYVASCYGCCGGRSLFPLFPGLRSRLAARHSCVGCSGCTGYVLSSSCHGASCHGSSCLGYGFGGGAGYYAGSVPGGAGYGSSAPGGVYYLGNSAGVDASTFGFGFAGMPTFPQGYSMGGGYSTGVVGPYYYGADFHNPPLSALPPIGPKVPPMVPPTPELNRQNGGDSFAALEYQASKAKPASAPARLTVELPADALLFVDGEKVPGTGPTRNFHTPSLPEGTFFYDLKAEVKVDGQPVVETVRVMVKGGEAKTETFGKLIAAVKGAKSPSLVSK